MSKPMIIIDDPDYLFSEDYQNGSYEIYNWIAFVKKFSEIYQIILLFPELPKKSLEERIADFVHGRV